MVAALTIFQSVFLSDITKAYEKSPNLESLLFDDFFNKGSTSFLVFPLILTVRST
jgi:6-phosphogluconate dehydrogenase